eukprot:GFUD01030620.1.p1 GENE.GFUD01030620.1~~GFUD01030620.1.p1  ORF type:complete len:347 (-),score=85.39 GFUD01030620.1:60-1100(-)
MSKKNSKPSGINGNLGEEAMGKLKLDSRSSISVWTDGASKDNHIAGAARVAGVGVVFGHPSLPHLYGPVEYNMTEKATNNAAELQAAILGLEQAKANNFKTVEMNTDSKLLENIMTRWLDQWKANGWKKSGGDPLKISVDLLKTLDELRTEMDITWKWLPRNSCREMILADTLANQGCKSAIEVMAGEWELNQLFRRTVYDRRMMYPDDLPPTVLKNTDEVMIPPGGTVDISCTLDMSDWLKQKLIENRSSIMNMTSDQAYGLITTMRTCDPLEEDGTVIAKCHIMHSGFSCQNAAEFRPTLVLPKGSVVGLAFSGFYGKNDESADSDLTGMMFFFSRIPSHSFGQ